MTYDLETFCVDIKNVLVNHFNTEVGLINTEKGGISLLATLDVVNGISLISLDDANMAADPLAIISVEDPTGEGRGPSTLETWSVEVMLVVEERGDSQMGRRLLRYLRALRQTFENHWEKMSDSVRIQITSIAPVELILIGQSNKTKAVGVRLQAAMM